MTKLTLLLTAILLTGCAYSPPAKHFYFCDASASISDFKAFIDKEKGND